MQQPPSLLLDPLGDLWVVPAAVVVAVPVVVCLIDQFRWSSCTWAAVCFREYMDWTREHVQTHVREHFQVFEHKFLQSVEAISFLFKRIMGAWFHHRALEFVVYRFVVWIHFSLFELEPVCLSNLMMTGCFFDRGGLLIWLPSARVVKTLDSPLFETLEVCTFWIFCFTGKRQLVLNSLVRSSQSVPNIPREYCSCILEFSY